MNEINIINKLFIEMGIVGSMFDVGAQFAGSSRPFLKLGWSVYAFEPDIKNIK